MGKGFRSVSLTATLLILAVQAPTARAVPGFDPRGTGPGYPTAPTAA